jgi:outer membrane protein TolC
LLHLVLINRYLFPGIWQNNMKVLPLLLPLLVIALPQLALSETIESAVQSALVDSPAVKQAISKARSVAEEITMAKSRLRPNVAFDAAVGPAYRDRSIDGASAGTGESLFSRRATVSLSQTLYDWGASGRLVASARMRELYQKLLIADAKEEQALLVADTYVSLLAARLKGNILADKVSYLLRFSDLAEKQRKKEGDTQSAVLRGRLGGAEADYEKARGLVEALERRFVLLTQRNGTGLTMPAFPNIGSSFVDMDSAPKVVAAKQAVKAQEANVQAMRKELMPTLGLEVRAGVGESVLGIQGPDNELSALAVVRWNPFDGGRKRAAIRQAQADLESEKALVEEIREAINDRVSTSQSESSASARRYKELKEAIAEMNGATKQFDRLLEDSQSGATPLSVAAIYGERNGAQLEAVDAWSDRYVSSYRVLSAAGQLLDYFNVTTTAE